MTDAELIAALGWEPCTPDPSSYPRCVVHAPGVWMEREICPVMETRLHFVRAGIYLARRGIASMLRARMAVPHGSEAAVLAMEWEK